MNYTRRENIGGRNFPRSGNNGNTDSKATKGDYLSDERIADQGQPNVQNSTSRLMLVTPVLQSHDTSLCRGARFQR